MNIVYKTVQSNEKPLEIDITSSQNGVYLRRNIVEKTKELEDGSSSTYFEYQEAFLTLSEYEQASKDLLVGQINGEDNTAEYQAYKTKLDTGVLYTNGKKYKPRYHEDYGKIMKDLETAISLIKTSISELETILQNPDITEEQRSTFAATIQTLQTTLATVLTQSFAIYDETGTDENKVMMNAAEIIALYFFLYAKKEQYFAEYKLEKETN